MASRRVAATPNLPIAVTLAPGDGGKVLRVSYRDLADNLTALPPITVVLDTGLVDLSPHRNSSGPNTAQTGA